MTPNLMLIIRRDYTVCEAEKLAVEQRRRVVTKMSRGILPRIRQLTNAGDHPCDIM